MILCDWRKAMPFPKPCEGQVSCMRLCHHGGHGSGRSLPVFADCCYSWLEFRASPYSGKVTNNPCICVCEGMVLFPATTVGAYCAVSSRGVGECPHSRRAEVQETSLCLLLPCLQSVSSAAMPRLQSINFRVGLGTQKKLGGGRDDFVRMRTGKAVNDKM